MGVEDFVNRAAIVGVGSAAYGEPPGPSQSIPFAMFADAFKEALDDAGLQKEDIDGLICKGGPVAVDYDVLAQGLNLKIRYADQCWSHGRFGCNMVATAAMVVNAGFADYVVCGVANSWRKLGVVGALGQWEDNRETGGSHGEVPWVGMTSPAAMAAMQARRYFHLYGATSRHLGAVAVAFRKHASMNPRAYRREPLTIEDHQNSPYVCEPLRRLDYCLNRGGAAVMIVTTVERARALKQPPVYISGFQGLPAGRLAEREESDIAWAERVAGEGKTRTDDQPAYRMAGVSQRDIDVLGVYDAFTTAVPSALEAYGFCKEGEGAFYIQDGRIEVGGALPMNTGGGHMNEGHVAGWNVMVELVRQLRGECGERQVKGAEVAQYMQGRSCLIFKR